MVGIIYGVQKAYSSDNGKVTVGDSTVSTWTMPGIPQCKVRHFFCSSGIGVEGVEIKVFVCRFDLRPVSGHK